MPPPAASTRLSLSSCWTRRVLEAPSARRTANSRCRSAPRTSSRLPTLTHAISNTSATTAVRSAENVPTRRRIPGSGRPRARSTTIGDSTDAERPCSVISWASIAFSSADACATVPPRDWTGAVPVRYPDPDIVTLDPRFARYVVANTTIRRLHTGMLWAEGPAWNMVGKYLVWSDIPNNVQFRWIEDDQRVTVFRHPSGQSNGNAFDGQAVRFLRNTVDGASSATSTTAV